MSGPCLLSSPCTAIFRDRNHSSTITFTPGTGQGDTALLKTTCWAQELKPVMDVVHPIFTKEEAGIQKGHETCPGSHSKSVKIELGKHDLDAGLSVWCCCHGLTEAYCSATSEFTHVLRPRMMHPGETRQRQQRNCSNCCHSLSHTYVVQVLHQTLHVGSLIQSVW